MTDETSSNDSNPKQAQGKSTSYLVALEKAKEDHKIQIWHKRLSFLKKGNQLMKSKLFGDAAVTYEKYLKILEMVYDVKQGELTPRLFKDSARTAELSVITSVYWDLLRIYDTSPHCLDRQKNAAIQLAKFATVTPMYADLVKKAEIFQRQCKNPDVIKMFLAKASVAKPKCFIATAAFGSPLAHEVQILRFYRDFYLRRFYFGRKFIFIYYYFSPALAQLILKSPLLTSFCRFFIRLLINCVSGKTFTSFPCKSYQDS